MKKVQVLGTGCAACGRLADLAVRAAAESGLEVAVEKVTEIDRILAFDVPATPALVVDGEVKVVGRVPSLDELKAMLT